MTLERKKELIYISLAFFTSIGQLTWIQMAYNEPSVVAAYSLREWAVMLSISFVFVSAQTLIAWKAYLSDPTGAPPPAEPPKTSSTG